MGVPSDNMTFGQYLIDERRRRGMSRRAFGDLLGIPESRLRFYENHGRFDENGLPLETHEPSPATLEQIAVKLRVDICFLIKLVRPNAPTLDTIQGERARLIAQQLEQLPDNVLDAVDAIIAGYGVRQAGRE